MCSPQKISAWLALLILQGGWLLADPQRVDRALEAVPAGATDLVPRTSSPAGRGLNPSDVERVEISSTPSYLEFTPETSEPVNFHGPFDQTFSGRIEKYEEPASDAGTGEGAVFSRNHAYWFRLSDWDAKTTNVELRVWNRKSAVRLLIKDSYLNFRPDVKWVNEKLLFIRVWWGRVVGSDYIYDVETGRFVYEEMVHDGTLLLQQTKQAAEATGDRK